MINDLTKYNSLNIDTFSLRNNLQNRNNKVQEEQNNEKNISSNDNSIKDINSISIAKELSPSEKATISRMKRREQEVIAHENAHIANGGNLVQGSASYSYETGPDGKKYISGGEVHIDMSVESGNPEATIRKMRQVRQAALAPSSPSSQDKAVANSATMKESQAKMELAQKQIAQYKDFSEEINQFNFRV